MPTRRVEPQLEQLKALRATGANTSLMYLKYLY